MVGGHSLCPCERAGRGRDCWSVLHFSSHAHLVLGRHDERVRLCASCSSPDVRARKTQPARQASDHRIGRASGGALPRPLHVRVLRLDRGCAAGIRGSQAPYMGAEGPSSCRLLDASRRLYFTLDHQELRPLGEGHSAFYEGRGECLDAQSPRTEGRARSQVESGTQPVDVFDSSIRNLPDEPSRDAKLMQMFFEFARSHPVKFLGLILMRFLIAVLPITVVSKSAGAVVAAWYAKGAVLVLLVLSIRLVEKRILWRIAPWLVYGVYWILMQSLAGAGLRYRLPADPAWACVVGVLFSALLAKTQKRGATA